MPIGKTVVTNEIATLAKKTNAEEQFAKIREANVEDKSE